MRVIVELAGFGPDRPAVFGGRDRLELTVPDGAVLGDVLAAATLSDTSGLSILHNGAVISPQHAPTLYHGDTITILYALEGG